MDAADDPAALVAAFDPGWNVGVALVDRQGTPLELRVATVAEIARLVLPAGTVHVVGAGTGRAEVVRALRERGAKPQLVDEQGTSLDGAWLWRRYGAAHGDVPWAQRTLPPALRTPGPKIDAYAAWAIALRYLGLPLPRRLPRDERGD